MEYTEIIRDSLIKHWNDVVIESYTSNHKISGNALASYILSEISFWNRLDLQEGEKISLCAPSGLEWAKLFIAISFSKYVAVSLPCDIDSALEAAIHSDCSVIYTRKTDVALIDTSKYANLKYIISISDNEVIWSRNGKIVEYKEATLVQPNDFVIQKHNLKDLALLIYTSGSSSRLKGVMLSYNNLTRCIMSNYLRFPYEDGTRYLSILPLNHIFGLMYDLLLPIGKGMCMVILDRPPIPEFIISAIRSVRPSMIFIVPIVAYKLIEAIEKTHAWDALTSCKMITCGGASVKKEFIKKMTNELNLPFYVGYGMSECSPSVCVPNIGQYEPYSCGQPIDCIEIKINSKDPYNIPGEILVKGESVFMGYYKDTKLTKENFTEDGWFRTSDIAYQSLMGNVFLCGRKDSMLSSGSGKNIYIDDIENVIRKSPFIEDVAIGFNDEKLKAYIVPSGIIDKEYMKQLLHDINGHFLKGIFISEVQYVKRIERTTKGSIKRSIYQ